MSHSHLYCPYCGKGISSCTCLDTEQTPRIDLSFSDGVGSVDDIRSIDEIFDLGMLEDVEKEPTKPPPAKSMVPEVEMTPNCRCYFCDKVTNARTSKSKQPICIDCLKSLEK